MEINLIIVLFILFWHWFADFVCQTDWMATNKSKNMFPLVSHTVVYSIIFGMCMLFINTPIASSFMAITFMCHTITDYFTSRLNSKLWNEKKVHWFFVSVGFDQFLHYAQLLLTYYILK